MKYRIKIMTIIYFLNAFMVVCLTRNTLSSMNQRLTKLKIRQNKDYDKKYCTTQIISCVVGVVKFRSTVGFLLFLAVFRPPPHLHIESFYPFPRPSITTTTPFHPLLPQGWSCRTLPSSPPSPSYPLPSPFTSGVELQTPPRPRSRGDESTRVTRQTRRHTNSTDLIYVQYRFTRSIQQQVSQQYLSHLRTVQVHKQYTTAGKQTVLISSTYSTGSQVVYNSRKTNSTYIFCVQYMFTSSIQQQVNQQY